MTVAPTLHTGRLTLRAHRMDDLAAFWAFYQSPRAARMDRPQNKTHLWYGFASEVGSWALQGQGGWAIDLDDRIIGQVAITQPPHFPERELGWMLFDGHEGHGYAQEAATAALDFAWNMLGVDTLVSYIHRDNARSIAPAERLGATRDASAASHDADMHVFRHAPHAALQDGGMEAYA